MTHDYHHLPEEPDPNEVARNFGVDPARERAGDADHERSDGASDPSAGEHRAAGGQGGRPIGKPSGSTGR